MDNVMDLPLVENDNSIDYMLGYSAKQGRVKIPYTMANALNAVSPMTFGADPTGVLDSSAAVLSAIAQLGARGGVVIFPPGIFNVQGLPLRSGLYYRGAGRGSLSGSTGTTLNLPAAPTTHLFISDATSDIYGGGVADMSLGGGQLRNASPLYDCFNFSTMTGELHRFRMENLYAHNFRHAFHGAVEGGGRDRSPTLHNCDFWFNAVALYTSEHPIFSGVNDIRSNNFGLTGPTSGSQPYDILITGQKFNYNKKAIAPQTGGTPFSSVFFNAGSFFKNEQVDMLMEVNCSVTNSLIVPEAGFTCGSISGNGTTTTIAITAHGLDVGDPVYFTGTGVVQLDKVVGLTVASAPSANSITVLTAYNSSTSGGKMWRGRNHFLISSGNNVIANNTFRQELIDEIKPDWMIYVSKPAGSITGTDVIGNRMSHQQTSSASPTVWTKFIGFNATEVRQGRVQFNTCRHTGQFMDTEGSTRLEEFTVSNNCWSINVNIGASADVFGIQSTTFGNVVEGNQIRSEEAANNGGRYCMSVDLKRSIFRSNKIRYRHAGFTAGYNVIALTAAGAGTSATIGASATGTAVFAAGPGALTDTCGVSTNNFTSAF